MPPHLANRRRGLAWAFAAAFGSALFVIPWKLANTAGSPDHSVLILLSSAALMNSALVVGQRIAVGGVRLRSLRLDFGVASLLAVFTLLGNLASAHAIQDLSPALLNVLLRAEVMLVAVLAWLLLGERVERRFWLGATLAMLGLFVLQERSDGSNATAILGAGTGMALAAAACFSAMSVTTRQFIHRIDPVLVNAIRLWVAVALWFPFHALPRPGEIPREQVVWAVAAATMGPFASRLCLMISARDVEARTTTLANLTSPLMTVPLGWALLADVPRPHQLLGGAIMIAGIAIPFLRRPRRD
jgi:drug/metabolite transporter (DMT)-like permease